jgi:hypothetical protein
MAEAITSTSFVNLGLPYRCIAIPPTSAQATPLALGYRYRSLQGCQPGFCVNHLVGILAQVLLDEFLKLFLGHSPLAR